MSVDLSGGGCTLQTRDESHPFVLVPSVVDVLGYRGDDVRTMLANSLPVTGTCHRERVGAALSSLR